MASVTIREPGRIVVKVAIADGMVIGRDPSCEIALGHRSVSRRHARLHASPEGLRIDDLQSRHGTLVDGKPANATLLRHGAVIEVGGIALIFADTDAEEPADDVTYHAPAQEKPGEDRLRVLYDLSRAVAAFDDPDELVGRVLEAAVRALGCERCVAGLRDGPALGLRNTTRDRVPGAGGEVVLSRTVLDALLTRRERVLLSNARAVPASLARAGVRAAMGVPLLHGSEVLGFLYAQDRGRVVGFSSDELDFLTALGHLLAAAVEQSRGRRRLADLAEAAAPAAGDDLIGASEPMDKLRAHIRRYAAARDTAVLVRGESGSGKELVARMLHTASPRAGEPFVAVNCAAIPDTMIESELFGHQRGAFTGAAKAYRGKFALAHRGTIFLDEVGDLSLAAQAKLLRALELGEVQPLGAETPLEIDARVVAATHKPLEAEIAAGRFREDLFYRLAVGQLVVPPLRARGDDVVALAALFARRVAAQLGKPAPALGPAATSSLRRYPWPGNVRELRNVIERAVILADEPVIDELDIDVRPEPARLPLAEGAPARWAAFHDERRRLEETEKVILEEALRAAGGVVARAARDLGVPRTSLLGRLRALGIDAGGGE